MSTSVFKRHIIREITHAVIFGGPILMIVWGMIQIARGTGLDNNGLLDDDMWAHELMRRGEWWGWRGFLLLIIVIVVLHPKATWAALRDYARAFRNETIKLIRDENNEHPSP